MELWEDHNATARSAPARFSAEYLSPTQDADGAGPGRSR
ncbi:hypothetical protein L083_5616 [Actinoplanes sp. N902-109]|nr:hypothetical protein L083_5616 [Actinoplanes sp. N902-109]